MRIKKLFLSEKPAQARDIARVLGCSQTRDGALASRDGQTVVSWCFGHLLEAAEPGYYCPDIKPWRREKLPLIPTAWQVVVKASCQKQFNHIKNLLRDTETVVIATDADREGELIAREVLTFCQFQGAVQRLWLSALDEASIQKALRNLREGKSTEPLYHAGLSRQRADWLIGMNMTMAASKSFEQYNQGVLSVGRVQTPTLKLVVDRDATIAQFKSKAYFELHVQFTDKNQQAFFTHWQPNEDVCDADGYCLDQQQVEKVAQKIRHKTGTITHFAELQKQQAAPLCLSLSQLQKIASSRFGFSVQHTLDSAQALYEKHKAITYPRSDCGYLPESQWQEAPLILKNLATIHPTLMPLLTACNPTLKSPTWNDAKITAHHALIPTYHAKVDFNQMTADEQVIYELICRYFIAQFLDNYEYAQRSVEIICENEHFKATSHIALKRGWKHAFNAVNEPEDNEPRGPGKPLNPIPQLILHETVKHSAEKLLNQQTKPPAHFTEGTLIEAMKTIGKQVADAKFKKILKETAGIGTEATRANILETLFNRGFMEKKGKQLVATEKGRNLIALLPAMVCDPLLTAQWEQALDAIAQGQLTTDAFLAQQADSLQAMLMALDEVASHPPGNTPFKAYPCARCQKPLVRRKSRNTNNYFWGCSQYPQCTFIVKDEDGKPAAKNQPLLNRK